MATEYKLSYTADEINQKLGMVDTLSETKLDASALDSAIEEVRSELVNDVLAALPTWEGGSY